MNENELKELKEQLKILNDKIIKLENEKEVDLLSTWDKNWYPEEDENLWYIDNGGTISGMANICTDYYTFFLKDTRMFKSKELAEKWLEIDSYLKEKSFEPDWENENQKKCKIIYGSTCKSFYSDCEHVENSFVPFYFEDEEIIDEILDKYTTKELEFYFNIQEVQKWKI